MLKSASKSAAGRQKPFRYGRFFLLALSLLALSCQMFGKRLPKGEDFLLHASFSQGHAAGRAAIFITKRPILSLRADIRPPFAGPLAQIYLFSGKEGLAVLPSKKQYQRIKASGGAAGRGQPIALFAAELPSLVPILTGEFNGSPFCSAQKGAAVCKFKSFEADITQKSQGKLAAVLKAPGQKDLKIKVRKSFRVKLAPEIFSPDLQGFKERGEGLFPQAAPSSPPAH